MALIHVDTTRFGRIEVSEDSILTFPSGLVGLAHCTRFVVIEEEHHPSFQWLQAVNEPGLAFVVIDATLIDCDYHAEISDDAIAELELGEADPVGLYVIVTIPPGKPEQATVNLRGPIVLNLRTRKAKQLVLHEAWPLKFPLCHENETDGDASRKGADDHDARVYAHAAPRPKHVKSLNE